MILIEARIKFCGQLGTEIFFGKNFKNFKNFNPSFIPAPGILGKISTIWKWLRFSEIGINETFINQVQLGFIRCKIIILIQSDVTFKILDFQIPKCSKSQIQYSSVNQAFTDGLSVVRIRPLVHLNRTSFQRPNPFMI